MVDYVKLGAVARKLISLNGAPITINKLNTTAADPSKPWRGAADPRNPLAASVTIYGVSVPLRKTLFGANFKKGIPDTVTDFYLAAPELTTPDLSDYDEVVHDGITFTIIDTDILRPNGVPLLYYLLLKK